MIVSSLYLLCCHDLLLGMHIINAYATGRVTLFVEVATSTLLLKTVNMFEEVLGCLIDYCERKTVFTLLGEKDSQKMFSLQMIDLIHILIPDDCVRLVLYSR